MAAGKIDAHIAPMGILPAVKQMMADGGRARLEEEMPDDWIEQLSISGTPEECVNAISRLVDAGANTVVLIPLPDKDLHEIERFASRLLPSL